MPLHHSCSSSNFAQINPALIFQNFINSGTGNTEPAGNICCTSSLLMKCQYTISVDDALSAKPDTFQPGLLPSFVRTLQNPPAFGLGYS
uniref:Uncharacterized protein n=1 Tax=Yersinia enterocolitica TaxID=630 RepID=B0RKT2_YEREN|nr:hypothetical protein [Yersinia enterocolitica]